MPFINARMELCSSGHEEVVYANRRCPVCDALSGLKMTEEEVKELKADVQTISHYIIVLENKLASYEADYQKWKEVVDKLEGRAYQEE